MALSRSLGHYIRVLLNNPRPFRFLLGRALVLTGFCERFLIAQAGYKLRFFPSNLSEQLWVNPALRDEPLEFFDSFLAPGDVVIDVGANIGDTCIVCARAVAPGGVVYAFEPHPRVFSWLEHNVRLNGLANVVLANLALGETEGTAELSDDRRDDMNRVVRNNGGALSVPTRTLDAALPDVTTVNLLKVDVEGFEIFVLRGAVRILQKTETVYIEVGQEHFAKYGYSPRDLFELLARAGFSLHRFVDAHELQPIDDKYLPTKVENILGVRDASDIYKRLAGGKIKVADPA